METTKEGKINTETMLLESPVLAELPVKHLCDFDIQFEELQQLTTPIGARFNFVIKGGTITGPRLTGRFLPGGGDWVTIGNDHISRLDVRATIKTEDGALIYLTSTGRSYFKGTAGRRYLRGDQISWEKTYARSAPLFETGAEDYAWLNGIVTVAHNEVSKSSVKYRIYEVG